MNSNLLNVPRTTGKENYCQDHKRQRILGAREKLKAFILEENGLGSSCIWMWVIKVSFSWVNLQPMKDLEVAEKINHWNNMLIRVPGQCPLILIHFLCFGDFFFNHFWEIEFKEYILKAFITSIIKAIREIRQNSTDFLFSHHENYKQ